MVSAWRSRCSGFGARQRARSLDNAHYRCGGGVGKSKLGHRRGIAAEAWTRTVAVVAAVGLALLAYAALAPRAGATQFLHVTTTPHEGDGECTSLKCTLR